MSEENGLELENLIISKLWYTAINFINNKRYNKIEFYDDNNVISLIRLIGCSKYSQRYSWIIYKLLVSLSKSKIDEGQLNLIELSTALHLIDDNISETIEQELLKLNEAVAKTKQDSDEVFTLTDLSLDFLERNLWKKPAGIHWIIEQLLCIWSPTFSTSDDALQNLYINFIKQIVEKSTTKEPIKSLSAFSHQIKTIDQHDLAVLLCILSKFNITEAKENEITPLLPRLLEICSSKDIEIAFYSRRDPKYFKMWHKLLEDTYSRNKKPDNLDDALKICSGIFQIQQNSNNIILNSNELFIRLITNRNHWLNEILDVCYILIINERIDVVSKILENPVLNHLWIVLLFKLLNECPNIQISSANQPWEKMISMSSSLKFVLTECQFKNRNDNVFNNLEDILENHFNILDWIIKCKRSEQVLHQNFSIKQIFHRLQVSSNISVIKMFINNLHDESFDDVIKLLKDSDDSKITYEAYYSMLIALKSILLCNSYDTEFETIGDNLSNMENHLNNIYPLDLRLEVMENIFSMIFLRHEDFSAADNTSDVEDELSDSNELSSNVQNSDYHTGFICNKYIIRELLHYLSRCIFVLNNDCSRLKTHSDPLDSINQRISLIQNYISEAEWRLELLVSPEFMRKQGLPDLNVQNYHQTQKSVVNYSSMKSSLYKPEENSSDEVDGRSDVDESSEGGTSTGSVIYLSGKRRKRMKTNKYSKSSEFTLNYMLASKETLILRCLWKSNYSEAQRVIEIFNMQNSYLKGEIEFSRAMNNFRQEILNQMNMVTDVNIIEQKIDSKYSTLDFIRKAAREGIQATRTTSQVETFLLSQENNINLFSNYNNINPKEIMGLITVDLALTMGHDNQMSETLADIAMKHLRMNKKLEDTIYYKFFETIYQLLYEIKGTSIKNILCDAKIPLSMKEYKERNDYWINLKKNLEIINEKIYLINEINNDDEDSIDEIVRNDLINLIDSTSEPYLDRLIVYLRLLQSITPKLSEMNSLTNLKSSIIENSFNFYIGYQIFELNIDLEVLEKITNQLQVNLIYGILSNSCPKLTCENSENSLKMNQRELLILNKFDSNDEFVIDNNSSDPNECVTEILSELLNVFLSLNFNDINIKKLSKNDSINNILRKTELLRNLDLSYLTFDDTLTFFLNIWNLLMLHSIIKVWSNEPPLNNLQHTISTSTIGYEISDLGIVTIYLLKTKLLNQSFYNLEHFGFNVLEELNEPAWQDLDLHQDPRVIFAMINQYKESPVFKIYTSNTLNDDLNTSAENYIKHYISQNENDILTLPKLIEEYQNLIEHLNESKNILDKFNIIDGISIEYKQLEYSYSIRLTYEKDQICQSDFERRKDSYELDWTSKEIKQNLLQYLEGHCWLLSYLVQRIHNINPTIVDSNCDFNERRTKVLENLLHSTSVDQLKALFNDNSTVAGLQTCINQTDLWDYFESVLSSSLSNSTKNSIVKCLTIIDGLPDSILMKNIDIINLKNRLIVELLINNDENRLNDSEILKYFYEIKDINIIAQLILYKFKEWPVRICEETVRHLLNHNDIDSLSKHNKVYINEILCRVMVFDKILPYYNKLNDNSDDDDAINWYNIVYKTEKIDPNRIVKSLIDAKQYELCLQWLEYQTTSSDTIHSLITLDLFIGLLNNNYKHAEKLLNALPMNLSIKLCKNSIEKLESIDSLKFINNYLLENSLNKDKYKYTTVGIELLEELDSKDRLLYINLIYQPILILEQLLMNSKFDNLHKIFKNKYNIIKDINLIEDFDKIIRFYAKKSLDSRVVIPRDNIERKDFTSVQNDDTFIMPINVPTKEEWTPDEKVRECSCCKLVIFSMFNRRHHCRRCGRVVCGSCSNQRMKVPGYSHSILLRVCIDCKRQSQTVSNDLPSTSTSIATNSSELLDYWRLTLNENHNNMVREEFTFEYAPNTSLCLTILNLHSDHKTYATFLLDCCNEMKALLYPDKFGKINPEIDYNLIIKMIKSLLIAAKVKCAKLGLNTGLTDCDRFLSQVDLISTLVQSDCLSLIPKDDIDDHTIRRLRDLLTEKEQWILALDVSTKAGLDCQGVWAAWGKTYLKVGLYEKAREKFAHCLDQINQDDFEDWVVLSYPIDLKKFDKRDEKMKEGLKNRPNKDPPLLTEILQILELIDINNETTANKNQKLINDGDDNVSNSSSNSNNNKAREIINNLNSVKTIVNGQYKINNINKNKRYQEILYYLLMYGSYNSILEFFIRYNELDKCLYYILENNIDYDLFFNIVYLECLKIGIINNLYSSIKKQDNTLIIWRKYLIYTCHCLEKKQLLNTLYQLQLFMNDYIRAAMTCIRFYITNVTNYSDISSRNNYLIDAQKHLETELQLKNFCNTTKPSVSLASSSSSSFNRTTSTSSILSGQIGNLTMEMDPTEIDKHINTILRQMEVAKFLNFCEKEGRYVNDYLSKLSFMDSEGLQPRTVPTLFGNQKERTYLAVLAILCGHNVEEGFGIAFRIMQDYNLRSQKVYTLVGHILASENKINSIEQLIKTIRSSGAPNSSAISDRVLAHCIRFLIDRLKLQSESNSKEQIDMLIKMINDIELKIECYIESKQLKTAYLIAVRYSREQDVRRILKEADKIGQTAIKSICTKWLQQFHQKK